ncbi:MAG: PQQ-binding-like beta-propeller repeat protein [Planctomycetaceae bacterium]
MSVRTAVLFFVVPAMFVTPGLQGQEWTRFRGPNGTGVSDATTIPVEWTDSDINWKAALPGKGHASPVIWGNRVFLLSADPKTATRYVLALNSETGQELWRKEYPSTVHHLHDRSSFASSTPAVDEQHVYVAWSTPKETLLKALTHDGDEVWSKDLGTWQSQHGFGTSPIVYEDMVILHDSQQANQLDPGEKPGDSYMMAFDRMTGDERWRTPLKSMNVCYSVPFLRKSEDGRSDELICTSTGNGMFSLDPRTGRENWHVNDGLFKMRTVSSPIEVAGLIFGSNGSGQYSANYIVAIQPGPDAKVAYSLENSSDFKAPYVPCLVSKDDLVFCIYDRGYASCIDATTGEVRWMERISGEFSGSPIRVNDHIYAIAEDGTVWVFAASDEYRLLARNPLGEPSRSTPAVANGRLFLRTESHLICVGGKSP